MVSSNELYFAELGPKNWLNNFYAFPKNFKQFQKTGFLPLQLDQKWSLEPKKIHKKVFIALNDQSVSEGQNFKSSINLLSSKYTQKLKINPQQLLNNSKTTLCEKVRCFVERVQKCNLQKRPLLAKQSPQSRASSIIFF